MSKLIFLIQIKKINSLENKISHVLTGISFAFYTGNSIYQLLQRCLEVLRREFSELKTVMADQLMYVKEDLILPHHYTFYDFIVTKVKYTQLTNLLLMYLKKASYYTNNFYVQARGKSGPLFTFDVHDDIRMLHDASVETEESHAGKVLLR